MKKILAVLLALTMALALAPAALALEYAPGPEALLNRSMEASSARKSLASHSAIQLALRVDGQKIGFKVEVDTRVSTSPLKMHMKLAITPTATDPALLEDMYVLDRYDMEMYLIQSGKKFTGYTFMDDEWIKTENALSASDMATLNSLSQTASLPPEIFKSLELGSQTYGGKEIYRVSGWLDFDSLIKQAMASSLDGFEGLDSDDAAEMNDILQSMDSILPYAIQIPVNIGIDPESLLPLYVTVDMTDTLGKIIAQEAPDESVVLDELTLATTYSYSAPQKITLPAAARKAKSVD